MFACVCVCVLVGVGGVSVLHFTLLVGMCPLRPPPTCPHCSLLRLNMGLTGAAWAYVADEATAVGGWVLLRQRAALVNSAPST